MNRYISDLHFGHKNIIRFDGRPFASVEEMEDKMVENWNSVVRQKDTTYILGDFCWSAKDDEWIRIANRLNGAKVLIRGNHDLSKMSYRLRNCFADVRDYKEIGDCGKRVIMSHYPMLLYKGAYNPDVVMLCGHVHLTRENSLLEKWRQELVDTQKGNGDSCGQVINVGCMMPYMAYTPRTLTEILNAYKGEAKPHEGN